MICPVELARDMSAFQAARVGDNTEHVLLTGRLAVEWAMEVQEVILQTHGQENHVVAGHGDHRSRFPVAPNGGATGCGKDAGWKSPKTDLSTLRLEIPQKCAGFPLSQNLGGVS